MEADELRLWFYAVQEARIGSEGEDWAFYNLWIDELMYAALVT